MNKIPNTEDFFKKYSDNIHLAECCYDYLVEKDSFKKAMIEFAKLHVTKALTSAHINMQLPIEDLEFTLNSYPLTNIK